MNREELLAIMSLPKKAGLVPKYREIYMLATGNPWTSCLCGNGFNTLYNTCLNFSKDRKKLDKVFEK